MPITTIEWEENNPLLLGIQAYDPTDGNLLQQADVSAMKLRVWDTDATTPTEMTPSGGEVLTVNLCVFDTAQPWDVDGTGYNVRIPISGTYLADGGKTYRAEFLVTPPSGEPYYLRHVNIKTIETYSQ